MVALTARQRLEFRAARLLGALPPRVQMRLSGQPPFRIDGQTLEPEIQLTLSLLERQGAPPLETLSPPRARAVLSQQAQTAAGRPLAVRSVSDLRVDGAAGPLPARHYVPDEPGGPHPLVLFFHGGGFVLGDLDSHDGLCRMLCRHMGAHLISVEYRLAPEHPFPAAVEDGLAAWRWSLGRASGLGADPARLAVAGDSAGAAISAVTAQRAAREGIESPALQLLLYPVTDLLERRPSHDLFGEGFLLTRGQMDWFERLYVGDADGADPRISFLNADGLDRVGPALVVTAGFDPLRDEGEAYAEALRAAGTAVVLRRFPGLIHGFASAAGVSRVCRDAVIEVAGAARAMLALAP